MLEASIKAQLQSYMERITLPIEITAHLDDSAKSRELHELLQEIAAMSDKVSLV